MNINARIETVAANITAGDYIVWRGQAYHVDELRHDQGVQVKLENSLDGIFDHTFMYDDAVSILK